MAVLMLVVTLFPVPLVAAETVPTTDAAVSAAERMLSDELTGLETRAKVQMRLSIFSTWIKEG